MLLLGEYVTCYPWPCDFTSMGVEPGVWAVALSLSLYTLPQEVI